MIIVGSLNSNKTQLLVDEYIKLINAGELPQNILFLTLNAYKKDKITNTIKAFLPEIFPNVQTFLGLCYNSVLNNWDKIQQNIKTGENKDEPVMCGLEVSQSLLLNAVKQVGFKDYNSKINLVHQLLRRHALIVGNNLATEEVRTRSEILGEAFADEAERALEIFKAKTLELRTFDYLRQQSLFKYLYENTDSLKNIQHVLIDDYDEQTPACTDFIKNIRPQLKSLTVGIDTNGSSRCGYLCADLGCIEILKTEKNIIKAQEKNTKPKLLLKNYTKRLEMLLACTQKISELINNGVSPSEISIITPLFDNQLKITLQNEFNKVQIPIQFISGSEKLVNDSLIKSIICLLRLINNLDAGIDEVNNIFPTLLKIPQKYAYEVLQQFIKTGGFIKHNFSDEEINKKYNTFLLFATQTTTQIPLSKQLTQIYKFFIAGEKITDEQLSNINFLEKQIKNLEIVTPQNEKDKILTQIENSIIAENDIQTFKLNYNSIAIGTPQKIVDFEIKTKYQFWLDITNDEWIKQDSGTIYNAWVFSRFWTKKEYTYDDSIKCVENKTKRLLHKLRLLCSNQVFALSSAYNPLGQENLTGLGSIFKCFNFENNQKEPSNTGMIFTPRPDQKPVLDYKSGKMAISAVPGAGKSTVLQALVSKILERGILAENIFVLTYMESAAKSFRERITNAYPNLNSYPNISTIHGLALRIIKENANYSKVNLDENFEICDDLLRQKLIRETIGEINLKYDEYEKYEKGISLAKFSNLQLEPKTKETKEFLSFYNQYNKKLSALNLIDYDDMLILAVKILEENPQILSHYQKICQYIIEDEAQDSSALQQQLLTLLAGKHKNIVRCGDINQAITSTFTNADTIGFRNFINENNCIEMSSSQRCAKGIYKLANNLIDVSKTNNDTKQAFYDIKMKEVDNKNPKNESSVSVKVFPTEKDEHKHIIDSIKEILKTTPKASIAILLRNNFQAAQYALLLKNHGIATISRTDTLEQNTIFNIILNILRFCIEPWSNSLVQEAYKSVFSIKEDNQFLYNLEKPFISIEPEELEDEKLIELHWTLNYWLSLSSNSFEFLALKIGEYYCKNDIDRSNLYIISEVIRRLSSDSKTRNDVIQKLEQIAKRPTIAGLKLFSENDTTLSTLLGGKVQIMTMHKSKGDEFDYVFIPEFTENTLGTELKSIKTGNYISFYEEIKALNPNYKTKNAIEIKKEILEENLRLLYVAITRAKYQLIFSVANEYKKFGRMRKSEPSKMLETLLG